MSRTFRNRRTVPKNYVVRDDGVLYCPTCCPNKEAQRKSWQAVSCPYTGDRCRCHLRWNELTFRRGYYRSEKKKYRKPHYRKYRAKMKDRMRHERWEQIIPYKRTSGWLSW